MAMFGEAQMDHTVPRSRMSMFPLTQDNTCLVHKIFFKVSSTVHALGEVT